MLKYCLEMWDKNKDALESKIRSDTSLNSCSYSYLVKLVVDYVLNQKNDDGFISWDSGNITEIDNGDYQGTKLFLIPVDTYQPQEYDYLLTYVGYGSCSGCDTLLSIQEYDEQEPSEKQVKDFMTLCKDILTNMIKPYNTGWRYKDKFSQVEV